MRNIKLCKKRLRPSFRPLVNSMLKDIIDTEFTLRDLVEKITNLCDLFEMEVNYE